MALEKALCETLSELEAMLAGATTSEAALPECDRGLVGLVADYVEGVVEEDTALAGLQAAFARHDASQHALTGSNHEGSCVGEASAVDEDEWNAEMHRRGRQRAAATLLSILRQQR